MGPSSLPAPSLAAALMWPGKWALAEAVQCPMLLLEAGFPDAQGLGGHAHPAGSEPCLVTILSRCRSASQPLSESADLPGLGDVATKGPNLRRSEAGAGGTKGLVGMWVIRDRGPVLAQGGACGGPRGAALLPWELVPVLVCSASLSGTLPAAVSSFWQMDR